MPIIIIVSVNKSKKRKQAASASPGKIAAGLQNDQELELLYFELSEELEKENPDAAKLKEINVKIKELKEKKQQAGKATTVVTTKVKTETDKHSGLNAILYVGALLIVGGIATLLGAALPDEMKMLIMLCVVVIFYVGGIVAYRDERLQTASKAFMGTALAVIPFLGLAFAGWSGLPGELAWFLTSCIGVVAYVVATVALGSKVIAYMSMAFVISLVSSMAATLTLPIVYYFMFVMLLGVAVGMMRLFAPNKVPKVFAEVVDVTGKYLTLFALVASMFVAGVADSWVYVWLFLIATLQIAVVWWRERTLTDELTLRVLAAATVLALAWNVFDKDMAVFAVCLAVVTAISAILCVVRGYNRRDEIDRGWEEAAQGLFMMVMMVAVGIMATSGAERQVVAGLCLGVVCMMGALSGLAAWAYGKAGWLYGVIAAVMVAPLIIGRWLVTDSAMWGAEVYLAVYIVEALMALGLIALLDRRKDKGGGGWVLACEAWMYLAVCGVIFAIFGLDLSVKFSELSVLCLHAAAAILVMMSVWRERTEKVGDRWRMGIALGVVVVAAMVATGISGGWFIYAGIVAVALFGGYGYLVKVDWLMEAAIYGAAIVICRMIGLAGENVRGDMSYLWVIYAHVMALALVMTSVWREKGGMDKVRLGFALGILTFAVGVKALESEASASGLGYQMLFIVEQAIIVVVGGLMRLRWVWIWGAIGVAVAILWMIRDVWYLYLILLGFALIAIVVWQLLKKDKQA